VVAVGSWFFISVTSSVRKSLAAIDAELPIWIGPFPLRELMAAMGNYWRLGDNAALFVVFGAIALLLASIGLFAVVAHAVQRRTREIGIRIAIGATARDVLMLVFRHGMRPSAIGMAVGLAGAIALRPTLSGQLVGVSAIDPVTLALAATVLTLAATLGCLLPAYRAMRVNPVVALRES